MERLFSIHKTMTNTNKILETQIDGLTVSPLFSSSSTETLLISLEKGSLFPTHTSPKTTFLVVLEGVIDFHIEQKTITLASMQTYTFDKDIAHHVTAQQNAKFLIIR